MTIFQFNHSRALTHLKLQTADFLWEPRSHRNIETGDIETGDVAIEYADYAASFLFF